MWLTEASSITSVRMSGKGLLWSSEEIESLLEVWADENIKTQLENTHKNAEIYRMFSEHLRRRGFKRTADQCRVKVKKLRQQYLKIRDSLRKTGSSTEEKDKFPWFDAIDNIIGSRPTSDPQHIIESHPPTPSSLDATPNDHHNQSAVSLPSSETTNELSSSEYISLTPHMFSFKTCTIYSS